ncbi:GNAT family N-acetyltransferase [Kitasatospora camelliae]|uniref:GNAT family N-acetyltransferase n=1 Tax=Kitasatospora camelliae TaxID=3156397 RepID=A0AAU8JWW8_9ACTN
MTAVTPTETTEAVEAAGTAGTAAAAEAVRITRLDPEELPAHLPGLAELLADAVDGGASVGFLAPFDRDAARTWWETQLPDLTAGHRQLWIARDGDRVLGTIGLVPERKPNGRHRAEIVKLMVHRTARGRGLARALLATAERAAADLGATLLILDTETDSPAEHLYRRAGWIPYGLLPDHAARPDGTLAATTFFRKPLTPRTSLTPPA